MKTENLNALPWFRSLSPILARVFRQRAAERFSTAEVELVAGRLTRGRRDVSRWPAAEFKQTPPRQITPRRDILVPVDFSSGSEETVDYAINVARRAHARLLLLHAVHLNLTPYGPANPGWLRTGLCREALAKLEPMMLRVQAAGVPVISVIEEGVPTAVIAGAAKRWKTDLIVLSATKRGSLARFFGQRTREKIVRAAECPVMVLQTDVKKETTI